MAGFIPNLSDYLNANQGLNPLQAAFSDIPGGGVSSDLFSTAAPLAGGFAFGGPIGGAIGALANLAPMLAGLFGGGRSSTGPGSATADIASGGGAYSDPVIRLLSGGAGALGSSTPISSPDAGPTFGPYFDVARKLEDLVRWGPGGLTDPRAEGLDATTLKNALTELGNPGKDGTLTLQALQNAFNTGSKYLTPDNLKLLTSQMNPQEQNIFNQIWGQQGGNTIPPGGNNPNNPFNNPSSNFNPMQNPLFANTNPSTLMNLLGGGGAPPMNIFGNWLGGRIGPPAFLGAL